MIILLRGLDQFRYGFARRLDIWRISGPDQRRKMGASGQGTLSLESRKRLDVLVRAERVEERSNALLAQSIQRGARSGNVVLRCWLRE